MLVLSVIIAIVKAINLSGIGTCSGANINLKWIKFTK